MYKSQHGVEVPDPRLYIGGRGPEFPDREPDLVGAIGSVRRTDVLVLTLQSPEIPGPDGIIETSEKLPMGLSALWSFAELLRIAAAVELDVSPNELQVGLQPWQTDSGVITRRIFIADSLENGAGYAQHLSSPKVLEQVINTIVTDIGKRKIESEPHKSTCDASCPDCLRNYDNRFIHSHLDWRLALDLAQLAQGDSLPFDRWMSRSETMAKNFITAFGGHTDFTHITAGKLHGVHAPSTNRTVLFTHPLWHSDPNYFVQYQRESLSQPRTSEKTKFFDLASLSRHPAKVFTWLRPPPT